MIGPQMTPISQIRIRAFRDIRGSLPHSSCPRNKKPLAWLLAKRGVIEKTPAIPTFAFVALSSAWKA